MDFQIEPVPGAEIDISRPVIKTFTGFNCIAEIDISPGFYPVNRWLMVSYKPGFLIVVSVSGVIEDNIVYFQVVPIGYIPGIKLRPPAVIGAYK
jgi:hypothetical protein